MRAICGFSSFVRSSYAVTAPTGASKARRAGIACLVAVVLTGCATTDARDPLEPLNRGIFEVNDAVDRAVVKPVAEAYVAVVPPVARTGVSNFFGNIYDVWNVVNNLLQGKVGTAFSDVGRIALNTTVGLLGVVDVASRVGLDKSDEDLGQTLGWWGLPHGPYLVLPFLGPSSVRDGTGTIVQLVLDPQSQIDDDATRWSLWGLRLINNRANLLSAERVLDSAVSDDRYAFVRDAYFQRRRSQLWDGNPPREKESSLSRPSVVQLAPIWSRPANPVSAAPKAPRAANTTGEFPPAILVTRTILN
ncbi:MAG: VacJ family lipoprotein [Proteobacteria bacterium]|nr:VacJ family lipoprotein [Burkholderiales bacterium]